MDHLKSVPWSVDSERYCTFICSNRLWLTSCVCSCPTCRRVYVQRLLPQRAEWCGQPARPLLLLQPAQAPGQRRWATHALPWLHFTLIIYIYTDSRCRISGHFYTTPPRQQPPQRVKSKNKAVCGRVHGHSGKPNPVNPQEKRLIKQKRPTKVTKWIFPLLQI